MSHSDVPIIVWPWHDYAAADWSTNPPADSPYTKQMFTDFIARAFSLGAEFVTVGDLAQRLEWFHNSAINTSISGSTNKQRLASSPVVADNRLFVVDTDAVVSAFAADTGAKLWSAAIGSTGKDFQDSLFGGGAAVDGNVV